MSEVFESIEAFQSQFGISDGSDYHDPITLKDAFGFSIKRKYPEGIAYKPACYRNGDPDDVAVIWISLKEKAEGNLIPVTFRISGKSIYLDKKYDYDFKDEASPTQESVEKSKKTPSPHSLDYLDEYFYDKDKSVFVDKEGKKFTGQEILDVVFNEHCDTVHPWKGLELRFKQASRSVIYSVISIIIYLLEELLKKAFLRELQEKDQYLSYYSGYDSMQRLESINTINIFGYHASRNTVFIFCLLIFIYNYSFYLSWHQGSEYIASLADNYFLIIVHSLFLLLVLDAVVPEITFWTLNKAITIRKYFGFMRFNPFSFKKWFRWFARGLGILLVWAGISLMVD
jgi:hypothetical protein